MVLDRRQTGTPRPRVSPASRLLSVIGAINWDISVFESRFARPGEEVPVMTVEEFSGGKGANAAVAAARVLGRGRVACLGALGDDPLRENQLAELAQEGVVVDGIVEIKGCQSGRAYILVDAQGRKTIHTLFGANAKMTPEHLREKGCAGVIRRTETMIVMDAPTPVALEAVIASRRRGARVIYSPGVRTQDGAQALERIMEMTDHLVVDRIELLNLYRSETEEGALRALGNRHPAISVVVTLGSRGCIVAERGSVRRLPGFDVSSMGKKVLNTTGCGDAFLGVFASYLVMGRNPLESARWSNLAGALKATRLETRGSPTREELEAAMTLIRVRERA